MSRLWRAYYDEILEDVKLHDALEEAFDMGYESHEELVGNYEVCHLKHKGCVSKAPAREVDILRTEYDFD